VKRDFPNGYHATNPKQQALEVINRLSTGQVSAVVGCSKPCSIPSSSPSPTPPYDDEPVSAEEAREIAEARASLARGEGIPPEEVLREFGLSPEDFERMGRTPLEPQHHPGQ
jgi:hypothetical protein